MSLLVTAAIWDEKNFSPDELPSKESRATRELWIDGSTLLVLQAIGDRADEKTGYAFPGGEELRKRARLQTDRGVRICMDRLKRTAHVVVLVEAHGEGYPNFYQVLTGRPERKILRDLLDQRDAQGNFRTQEDAAAYAALMAEMREAGLAWLVAKGFTHRVLTPAVRESLVTPPRRRRNRNRSSGSDDAASSDSSSRNRNSSSGSDDRAQNGNSPSGSSDENRKGSAGSGPEPEQQSHQNRNSSSAPYMEEQSGSGVVVHSEEQQHPTRDSSDDGSAEASVEDQLMQELIEQLVRLGITPEVADDLAQQHPADRIEAVLYAARSRTPKNPAGWVVAALTRAWPIPPAPPRRRIAEPAPTAAPTDTRLLEFEEAADAALASLPPGDRADLEDRARAAIARRFGVQSANSQQFAGALVRAELRRLAAEQAGIPEPFDSTDGSEAGE